MIEILDWSLQACRQRKSPFTGFVHTQEGNPFSSEAIPVYENFCYVLALLRTSWSEHRQEVKSLLEALLPFEVEGQFPLYLHEFPQVKSRLTGLNILAVLNGIIRLFAPVLGREMTGQLEALAERIITTAGRIQAERPLPLKAWVKWKAYADPQALLDASIEMQTPEEWADYLIALQMVADHGLAVDAAWEQVRQLWDSRLDVFLGPQSFERGEPKVTLLDLWMGSKARRVMYRPEASHLPVYMHATQMTFFPGKEMLDPQITPPFYRSIQSSRGWDVFCGTPEKIYTLSGVVGVGATGKIVEDNIYHIRLVEEMEGEEKAEIPFSVFWNRESDCRILINGQEATVFHPGDQVEFWADEGRIKLVMEVTVEEGEGVFFGHILPGRRPGSAEPGGDWQVMLRTIRRSVPCAVKVCYSDLKEY